MRLRWLLLVSVLFGCTSLRAQNTSTPEGALIELATTTDPKIVEKHLSESVKEALECLSPKEKEDLLLSQLRQSRANGLMNLVRSENGNWEVVDRSGERTGTLHLINTFWSGNEAFLHLHLNLRTGTKDYLVAMRLEDKEWRFVSYSEWAPNDLGLEESAHRATPMGRNEEAAAEMLGTLAQMLQQHFTRHREQGFPLSLALMLAQKRKDDQLEREQQDRSAAEEQPGPDLVTDQVVIVDEMAASPTDGASQANAQFMAVSDSAPVAAPDQEIDDWSWLEQQPMVYSGYVFQYQILDMGGGRRWGSFTLSAVPIEYGKSGKRSFLRGADYKLHYTTDNRPATQDDPIVP